MSSPQDFTSRPQDPYVTERHPTVPARSFQLVGLLGDSDRSGRRRLYLTTALDYFVEFRTSDVVAVASVPPEEPPFVGLDATRVTLDTGAALDWVQRSPGPHDPFALEALDRITLPPFPTTRGADCPGMTHPFGESEGTCPPRSGLAWTCRGGGPAPGGHPHPGGGFGVWPTEGEACRTVHASCATCDQSTCVTCTGTTCESCRGTCEVSCGGTCDGRCLASVDPAWCA